MKKMLIPIILIIVVLFSMGCSPKKEFTITIKTNPTTGFDYVCTIEGDSIALVGEETKNPNEGLDAEHMLLGAASMRTYTFKILKEGYATIDLNYKRNWEGGEDAWHIYYEIEVNRYGEAKLYDKNVQDVDLHFSDEAPDPKF